MNNHVYMRASLTAVGLLLLQFACIAGAVEGPMEPSLAGQRDTSPWRLAAEQNHIEVIDLYAIALQESRLRRADGMLRPWPWTLNSPETGPLYFATYEAALERLTALIAEGKTNIDIGVMQINWGWNGYRVGDPKRLLLPAVNIKIAAQILREHLNEYGGDLRRAIARYHNPRAERGIPYAASVLAIRNQLLRAKAVQLALAA